MANVVAKSTAPLDRKTARKYNLIINKSIRKVEYNMNQELIQFPYVDDDGLVFQLRAYKDDDGEVWLVAKDVCDVLGLTNARRAIMSLDDDEKMTVTISYSQNDDGISTSGAASANGRGGARFLNVINESGLYALVFRSRKPFAKKFRKWVTSAVLP